MSIDLSSVSKKILIAIIIVVVVIVASFGVVQLTRKSAPQPLKEVAFSLDYVVSGRDVPFYAALENGYYEREGLHVTINSGQGSSQTALLVDQGKIDIGIVDSGSFIIGAAQGEHIKAVMAYSDYSSAAIVSLKPLNTPKDLEGLTFGTAPSDSSRIQIRVLMQLHGANYSLLKYVAVDPAVKNTQFLQGKIDVISAFLDDSVVVFQQQYPNQKFYVLAFSNWMPLYGHFIIANPAYIQQNPDVISAFVKGTIEGVRYSIMHPEEATQAMIKYSPVLKSNLMVAEWQAHIPLKETLDAKNNYGHIDPKKFEESASLMLKGFGISTTVDMGNVYTNQFIPNNLALP